MDPPNSAFRTPGRQLRGPKHGSRTVGEEELHLQSGRKPIAHQNIYLDLLKGCPGPGGPLMVGVGASIANPDMKVLV